MNRTTKFVIAVAVQIVIIAVIVIAKLSVLASGTTVFLRIEPVDPRDPLRGDYLRFQYSVSHPYAYEYRGSDTFSNGDTVYVSLRQSGKFWVEESFSKEKPADGTFLKGTIVSGATTPSNAFPSSGGFQPRSYDQVNISYGIEEYFIPEGKGRDLSMWRSSNENAAEVAVDNDGNSVLKKVYVDGKPF